MHYYKISGTDIEEAIKESRRKAGDIKINYRLLDEIQRSINKSRRNIDKFIRETRYQ